MTVQEMKTAVEKRGVAIVEDFPGCFDIDCYVDDLPVALIKKLHQQNGTTWSISFRGNDEWDMGWRSRPW
jgi:hypothetical protein